MKLNKGFQVLLVQKQTQNFHVSLLRREMNGRHSSFVFFIDYTWTLKVKGSDQRFANCSEQTRIVT